MHDRSKKLLGDRKGHITGELFQSQNVPLINMCWIFTAYLILSVTGLERSYGLVAQMVKNLPAMQETHVLSLGWEDLLEKGMATHSSILAWRIPWTEEPGGLQSIALQIVGHNWASDETRARNPGTSVSVPALILPDKMSLTTSIFLSMGFPGSSAGKKNLLTMQETWLYSWVRKFPWRRYRLPTLIFSGFSWWLRWWRICLQCRRPGFDPWIGQIPWRRAWQPTPVFFPGESPWTEEPGRLQCMGVTKSLTWLSNFHFHFPIYKIMIIAYNRI